MKKLVFSACFLATVGARPSFAADFPKFLEGVIVPMVTPYGGPQAENVDLEALKTLTEHLSSSQASALYPVSGTGQWKLLSLDERKQVIETCVRAAGRKKPVIAGVGSPTNLDEVLELARFAEKMGAAAVVAVTPLFVRNAQPQIEGRRRIWDQELLIDYYKHVAAVVHCPVIVDDPEAEIEPSTMARLVMEFPNIKGIKVRPRKDPTAFPRMVEAVNGKAAVLSGSEIVALHALQQKAVGVVGAGFNVYPNLGADLIDAIEKDEWARAEEIQRTINEANAKLERLGGGAQGVKKILNDVVEVSMSPINRGDTFRPESRPGEYAEIVDYFRRLDLPVAARRSKHPPLNRGDTGP